MLGMIGSSINAIPRLPRSWMTFFLQFLCGISIGQIGYLELGSLVHFPFRLFVIDPCSPFSRSVQLLASRGSFFYILVVSKKNVKCKHGLDFTTFCIYVVFLFRFRGLDFLYSVVLCQWNLRSGILKLIWNFFLYTNSCFYCTHFFTNV